MNSNMRQNNSIIYLSLFVVSAILSCTKIEGEDKHIANSVITGYAENVTATSATVYGYIKLEDKASIKEFGILWSLDPDVQQSNSRKVPVESVSGNGKFSVKLQGIYPGEIPHYYRAYAKESSAIHYGAVKSFVTDSKDVVRTLPPVLISSVSADIPSAMDIEGIDYGSAQFGIVYTYGETLEPGINSTVKVSFSDEPGKDSYTTTLLGLYPNTVYRYCAYAVIDGHKFFGKASSFVTGKNRKIIWTNDADNIGYFDATLSGSVDLSDITHKSRKVGFEYAHVEEWMSPTDIKWKAFPAELNPDNSFCAMVTDLVPGETYDYRAVIEMDNVKFTSDRRSFQTKNPFHEVIIDNIGKNTAHVSTVMDMEGVAEDATFWFGLIGNENYYLIIWDNPAVEYTQVGISTEGVLSLDLSDLSQDLGYSIRPMMRYKGKIAYGPIGRFRTLPFEYDD